ELARHRFAQNPIGNGPFRFVGNDPGQQWVFEANADYPEDLGGRPYLDRLVLRVVPEPTTRLTELLSGRTDLVVGVTAQQRPALDGASAVRLVSSTSAGFDYISWNTRSELFSDSRLRKALTMAMDRQAIVDAIRPGEVAGTT